MPVLALRLTALAALVISVSGCVMEAYGSRARSDAQCGGGGGEGGGGENGGGARAGGGGGGPADVGWGGGEE
ncbi:hypothetical protein ACRCQ4_34355 [Pseudomonas aeruginosa]